MRVINGFLLSALLTLSSAALSKQNLSDIDSVTIDGQEIPSLHYEIYAEEYIYDDNFICPPSSNDFVRDQVIGIWLRSHDAIKTNTISDDTKTQLEANDSAR